MHLSQFQTHPYCHDIELRVEQGELNNVVWGNHDTVNRHLDQLGDKRNLVEWFEYL